MAYFQFLPNVYIGEGVKDDEPFKYRLAKNISRRIKVREDLEKYVSLFESYSVREGETPATIASAALGNAHLDWVVLLTNNITDFYAQWPLNESDLQDMVVKKYGDPETVHHYETKEVLYNGVVYIKEGIEVNSTFRAVMPDGTTKGESDSIYAVSNYEHEQYLNELKRLIKIPNQGIVDKMIQEFETLVAYAPHAELDDVNNKKSPLSIASRFFDAVGYVSGSASASSVSTAVTSFDNGPSATSATAGVVTSTTS